MASKKCAFELFQKDQSYQMEKFSYRVMALILFAAALFVYECAFNQSKFLGAFSFVKAFAPELAVTSMFLAGCFFFQPQPSASKASDGSRAAVPEEKAAPEAAPPTAAPPPAVAAPTAAEALRRVDEEYKVRELMKGDFAKGFVALLAELTDVGDLDEDKFHKILQERVQAGTFVTVVAEHRETGVIAATASLIVERKFVHGGACCGHVEDVVVATSHRRKGLAQALMGALTSAAEEHTCYKLILDCKRENCGLYEKCGYRLKEVQMRMDLH